MNSAQKLRNVLNVFACYLDAHNYKQSARDLENFAKEYSDDDGERLWKQTGIPDRTGARYAYTVHVGSHDGPLYWGYSGLEFDTVAEAREHATKTWERDVAQGRTMRPKSELYLKVSPVSVHYVSTPGSW